MAVLIWHRDAKGDLISRCDAKCYNSFNTTCKCICGGMNHGIRYYRALQKTARNLKALEDQEGVTVAARVKQENLDLFRDPQPS